MGIEILLKIGAIGLLVVVINQVLTHAGKNEIATYVTLAGVVIVLVMVMEMIANLFNTVQTLFGIF